MKNPNAVALGKLGGSKKSDKKTKAARANIEKRWRNKRTTPHEGGSPSAIK